jgi:16S rRNA (uracil1498-N3)-methyltransferase
VLRLAGERADKKLAHWQGVAVSACEQCGGNRVPTVYPVQTLTQWLKGGASTDPSRATQSHRLLLSLRAGSQDLRLLASALQDALFLSGPEGGPSPTEEDAAIACGFAPVSLGARVLRAETAALAALTLLA